MRVFFLNNLKNQETYGLMRAENEKHLESISGLLVTYRHFRIHWNPCLFHWELVTGLCVHKPVNRLCVQIELPWMVT